MVKSGLVHQPYVSHIRLAIHLLNAFLTFGYIYWVSLGLRFERATLRNTASSGFKKLSLITFILLIIQIAYGAFVAGLKAGHFYNTWPKMGDEWIATTVGLGFEKHGWLALFNDMSVVQFVHRCVALLVVSLITYMLLGRKKKSWKLNSAQQNATLISFAFVTVQLLLGIFTLLYAVPISLGVIHQAGAFFIFAALIYQLHRTYKN
jgi:cytochrome c oxidase assembly protein subunit 15